MDKREYKELSSQAANGDAKAFSRLYEKIYRPMYYTAFYTLVSDSDAIAAVQGAARDGFKAIGHLRSEEAFCVFMMKTLCARIKTFFKEYGRSPENKDYRIEEKQMFFELENADRLCAVMYIAGRFTPEEISQFSGMSKATVKKRLARALDYLDLDE